MFPNLHELSSGELFQLERIRITELPHKIGGVQMSPTSSAATAFSVTNVIFLQAPEFSKAKELQKRP